MEKEGRRMIGDYVLGPKIGTGSFAVVWRSWGVRDGVEVAVKEINRKQLSAKLNDSLLKEITILGEINHPNIVRLHDAIVTDEKIYLVLEYCTNGDLAAYIQRLGRVSEVDARHFMRHLASGLQALRKHNLIHRDLKPQNLLLSREGDVLVLKIGDFGFARHLKPQGLADTLCGSPLYMAPEIIQFQKYDAKADLWSVGAILFQLVTGRPPFEGNNQFQLFQNVLMCKEVQFPTDIVGQLHPDCIDLCKRLLRRNPVERLSFEEFFNHKFLAEQTPMVVSGYPTAFPGGLQSPKYLELTSADLPSTSHQDPRSCIGHLYAHGGPILAPLSTDLAANPFQRDWNLACSNPQDDVFKLKSADVKTTSGEMLDTAACSLPQSQSGASSFAVVDGLRTASLDHVPLKMSVTKVNDSLECIEHDYVMVNRNVASTESISSSVMASLQDQSVSKSVDCSLTNSRKAIGVPLQFGEGPVGCVPGVEISGSHGSVPSAILHSSVELEKLQQTSQLYPSNRLKLLLGHAQALSALAKEKLDAQLQLEALSVELVALTVWRKGLSLCKSHIAGIVNANSIYGLASGSSHEQKGSSSSCPDTMDFSRASSVCTRVERGFIAACDQAEALAAILNDMDGDTEMPDAMETIFQAALAAGRTGGVEELMGNQRYAVAAYSKAIVLLSFILTEALSLPLNPPFRLDISEQQRLHRYFINLKAHQDLLIRQPASTSSKQLQGISDRGY